MSNPDIRSDVSGSGYGSKVAVKKDFSLDACDIVPHWEAVPTFSPEINVSAVGVSLRENVKSSQYGSELVKVR